ncbi:DUF4304 domain-containing protein, partial [Nocardioides hankookensis]
GLVDAAGRLTEAGRATKDRVEALTDVLAEAPYDGLTAAELDELVACLEPIARPAAGDGLAVAWSVLVAAFEDVSCATLLPVVDGMTPKEREGFDRFLGWRTRPKKHASDRSEPSPQEVYAEWMKTAFGPTLRAEGMRGSGGRFEFPSDVVWAQLGFQKSTYSDAQEVRFTVNLSVIQREMWEEQHTAKPHLGKSPSPSFHYGAWADQVRIGLLAPDGEDKWWRIVRGVQSSEVRDDVLHDLLTYAVPWLRTRVR